MEQQDVRFLILISSVTIIILVIMTISLFLYFQKKKAQFLLERKKRQARFEEELVKAQREISEQTMQNISWELHDNIGQLLSVVKMRLNLILQGAELPLKDEIGEINEVVSTSLFEVRQLSKSLNRKYIEDIGLIRSIEIELERYEKLKFFQTELSVVGSSFLIPPKDELILFRILQEFFSNVIKHAKASHLAVNIQFVDEQLHITVQDDGIGFDPDKIQPGTGLMNMSSRAKLINAELNIQSGIKKGVLLGLSYSLSKD